jgi:hypothetical protein
LATSTNLSAITRETRVDHFGFFVTTERTMH